jgi:hypothetical protein
MAQHNRVTATARDALEDRPACVAGAGVGGRVAREARRRDERREVSITDGAIVAIGVAGTDRCLRSPEAAEALRLDDVARPSLSAMFRSASTRAYSESDYGSARPTARRRCSRHRPQTGTRTGEPRRTGPVAGPGSRSPQPSPPRRSPARTRDLRAPAEIGAELVSCGSAAWMGCGWWTPW